MKTINLFLLISILLVFSISAKTQNNCYIQLGDLSGFNTAPYQAELEAAACELIQAFPSEFQEQFKVYSFGFYAHNEYMQGGFEEAFQKVADEIQTPYYLVIGRQTDHTGIYSRFWVELELPTRNNFKCYNQDYINKVEFQIIKSISDFHLKLDKIPELYFKSEIIGIHFLEKTINEMVECCNHDNIIRGVCSLCSWSFQDIIDYYEVN
nr:hypothetical protein [Saprospiraceae bacterium]